MTRYKVILEYDGTDLIGWQENRQGSSVQSIIKDAIFGFCKQRPDVVGAGRTDAGVHAVAMTAHFDIDGDFDANTVMRAYEYLQRYDVLQNSRGIGNFVCKNARAKIMEMRKTDFIENQLPAILKQIDILEIPWQEIDE